MRRILVLVVTAAIVAGACGGDDDDGDSDGSPAVPADEAATESGDDASTDDAADEGDFIVPEVSDDDDLTTQILAKVFGLPASFVTDEARECMSAELAPLFPGGVVPDDLRLTEELATALNDAGETCGVDLQG